MPRTGRVYEKPSRISQGLVVCLSIAVVLMAGWLAITIMLSNYATTSAVGDTNVANAPVQVENVSPEPEKPRVAPRANSTLFERWPRDDAFTAPTPPRSALLPLASFAEPPPAATHDPGYASLSFATVVPEVRHSSIPAPSPFPPPVASSRPSPTSGGGSERGQPEESREGAVPSVDAAEAIADLMRLPPPTPYPPPRAAEGRAGMTSVPVPRPRPRLESEDVQPVAEDRPSSDSLIDRRR
jgi:hypothetical protein